MSTPKPPQQALSESQTAERPLSGVLRPDGPRRALYAHSGAWQSRPTHPGYDPKQWDSTEKQIAPLRRLVAGERTDPGPAGGTARDISAEMRGRRER